MKAFPFFFLNPKLFILPVVASILTWLSVKIDFTLDISNAARFFFIGLFFCFGIIMNAADQRRFQTFEALARIKACLITYWQISLSRKLSTENQDQILEYIEGIIPALKKFLRNEAAHLSDQALQEIDYMLSKLTTVAEILRQSGVQSPEISRFYQTIQNIYESVELLISIKTYRTPLVLRSFIKTALILSLFVLVPDFARYGYYGIFFMAIIAYFMSCLILIQNQIEHPFREHHDGFNEQLLARFTKRLNKLKIQHEV